MALSEVAVGESAVLASIELPDSVGDHLMHLGFLPEAAIDVLRRAPAGDPTVYRVDGAEIALRRETAQYIQVRRRDRI
jgi:Fe2+ transport system protein FeoA